MFLDYHTHINVKDLEHLNHFDLHLANGDLNSFFESMHERKWRDQSVRAQGWKAYGLLSIICSLWRSNL